MRSAMEANGLRGLNSPRLVGIPVLITISALAMILASCFTSANLVGPRPPPDTTFRLTDPVSGIAWLFFVNVLVNLACFSGVLLAFTKRLLGPEDLLRTNGLRFLGTLACVVIVITIVGAFVDFYLVAQPRYIDDIRNSWGDDISGTYRVFVFDAVMWALALVAIGCSIVLASITILRMAWKPSVGIAVTMATLNLMAWILVGVFGEDIVFISIIFGALLAPVLVSLLVRWYAEGMPEKGTPQAA